MAFEGCIIDIKEAQHVVNGSEIRISVKNQASTRGRVFHIGHSKLSFKSVYDSNQLSFCI